MHSDRNTLRSNFARVTHSPRLQRLLMLLSDGRQYTTMQIVQQAGICAVNSAVHELRCQDIPVACRIIKDGDDRVYAYQLEEFVCR